MYDKSSLEQLIICLVTLIAKYYVYIPMQVIHVLDQFNVNV